MTKTMEQTERHITTPRVSICLTPTAVSFLPLVPVTAPVDSSLILEEAPRKAVTRTRAIATARTTTTRTAVTWVSVSMREGNHPCKA